MENVVLGASEVKMSKTKMPSRWKTERAFGEIILQFQMETVHS